MAGSQILGDSGFDDLPKQLGQWQLDRVLGSGMYGRVLEAHWVGDGDPPMGAPRQAALKVIEATGPLREKARKEAETGQRLVHANLLRTYYHFVEKDWVVLVLELADSTLAKDLEQCEDDEGLPEDELRAVAIDVARGLTFLHESGCVHNDVKSENVLRVGDVWKLGDFGISAHLYAGQSVAKGGGNVIYLPPEAAHDRGDTFDRDVTRPSYDVWAFGLTMHLAATRRDPRGSGAWYKLLSASRDMLTDAPHLAVDERLGPRLRAVLQASLSRAELRVKAPALVELLETDAVIVGPEVEVEPATTPLRRRATRIGTVAAGVGALVAAAVAVPALRGSPATSAASTTTSPPLVTATTSAPVTTTSLATTTTGPSTTTSTTAGPARLASLALQPVTDPVTVGSDTTLVLTGQLSDGSAASGERLQQSVWTSSAENVATVTAGTLHAVGPGTTTITVVVEGAEATLDVQVTTATATTTKARATGAVATAATTPPVVTTQATTATTTPTVATLPQAPTTNTTLRPQPG